MKMLSNPVGKYSVTRERMSLWAEDIEPELSINLMNFEIQKGQNNHKHRKKLI